ncbi:TRAF-type zinc finger domain-containing protein 1 isoform X2 [Aethina tumida]|uniref:TRAF-type zinc finger domain-containing protein 1 isoform X2 n=1 Tax=Aethina tumida TaxID=116153 RepID=UPI0021482202|nr:TRAF-type zinc finger domain-containing protein 1 isoform X2 [Aethina tumida]
MDREVEHELCANCKKEIPQPNYVMHTVHCARNITLCKTCNEPFPKSQYDDHARSCKKPILRKPSPPPTSIEKSSYYQQRKVVEEEKTAKWKEERRQRHERLVDTGYTLRAPSQDASAVKKVETVKKEETKKPASQNGAVPRLVNPPPKSSGLLACKYCDLELPKLDLEEHENYCGSRTDKCLECGELVMFKYKQLHMDTNHGFLKLKDGPRPSWDSTTQRSASASSALDSPRRRPVDHLANFDYDPLPYMPNAFQAGLRPQGIKIEKGESYKEISRRLDCKTEYIRNLLHDSASITIPLRHSGTAPRNHFNHNKGPAPQPPRRRNPPTELQVPCEYCSVPFPHEDLIDHENICRLIRGRRSDVTIPCEFCDVPILEEDLILHQTGCRPDLTQRMPRRHNRSPIENDDYYVPPPQPQQQQQQQQAAQAPSSPEVELPCEFCADMFPASQLLRHQATCS